MKELLLFLFSLFFIIYLHNKPITERTVLIYLPICARCMIPAKVGRAQASKEVHPHESTRYRGTETQVRESRKPQSRQNNRSVTLKKKIFFFTCAARYLTIRFFIFSVDLFSVFQCGTAFASEMVPQVKNK